MADISLGKHNVSMIMDIIEAAKKTAFMEWWKEWILLGKRTMSFLFSSNLT